MGADLLLSVIPSCDLTEDRVKRLNEIIDQLAGYDLAYVRETHDMGDDDAACRDRLREAVDQITDLNGHRHVSELSPRESPFCILVTGGLSWGDAPTEIGDEFDLICGCEPLYEQLEEWARIDGKDRGRIDYKQAATDLFDALNDCLERLHAYKSNNLSFPLTEQKASEALGKYRDQLFPAPATV